MASEQPDPTAGDTSFTPLTGDWQGAATVGPDRTEVFAPGRHAVPGYELLGELGRGGMGVVYKARHIGLNREVALKMVLSGAHAGPTDRARFRAEAETVAQLKHPNVVQVYDVGEADGLPYLSLEVCDGSLADRLDGTPWQPERAAALIAILARAAHAAHTAGVIHRDLKPGNVLLTSDGTPKLTDFGLAKRVGDSGGPTATGAVLGTPSYMAPEQASGTIRAGAPGPRIYGPPTDVYALGAILYELLTGRPPFKASSPLDTLMQVVREEPVPPARLALKTPRDLQTICLKCLAKEPGRRYGTAAELADDLDRFCRQEPIVARPVPAWERGWKWAKRRPAAAGLVAVSAAALITLGSLGWVFSSKLQQERDAAMAAKDKAAASLELAKSEALKARRNNYVLAMGQAQFAWQQSAMGRLRRLLKQQEPADGEDDLRGFEWHYWDRMARGAPSSLTAGGSQAQVNNVGYTTDGKRLVAADQSGEVHIWNAETNVREQRLQIADGPLMALAIDPKSRWCAVGGERFATVIDLETGKILNKLAIDGGVGALAVRTTDSLLAIRYAKQPVLGRVEFWDLDGNAKFKPVTGQSRMDGPIAFSPDGRWLAVGGAIVRLWDVERGEFELRARLPAGQVGDFSPDSRRLAIVERNMATQAAEIRVVDLSSGQVIRCTGHLDTIRRAVFNQDGRRLASAADDNTVRLWDTRDGHEVNRFRSRTRWNPDVAFRPGSPSLAEASSAGIVELWPLDYQPEFVQDKAHSTAAMQSFAMDADNGRVVGAVTVPGVGVVRAAVDDLTTHKTLVQVNVQPGFAAKPVLSHDGRYFAAGLVNGHVRVWDLSAARQVHDFGPLGTRITSVAISGDGRYLAAAAHTNRVTGRRGADVADRVIVWDIASGQERWNVTGDMIEQINVVSLSRDGKRLLTGTSHLAFRIWDVETGQVVATLGERGGASQFAVMAAISPDGRFVAVARTDPDSATDPGIDLMDIESGKLLHTLAGHGRDLTVLTFSSDGQRLATAGQDDTVKVWDVATGQEVLSRPAPRSVVDVGFTGDRKKLLAVGVTGEVRVWHAGD